MYYTNMFDFIGDIHGEFDKLILLLEKLGYQKRNGIYSHSSRKVFFLGDLIDRGPKSKEVLELVKRMVENDHAKIVMGNHEFNLICYFTKDKNTPSLYLRNQNEKHYKQCKETLDQLNEQELKYYLSWLKTIPFYFETENFRAVHASWNQKQINLLKELFDNDTGLNDFNIQKLFQDKELNLAMELTLKGPEIKLADGVFYLDKDGNKRTRARYCWWNKDVTLLNSIKTEVNENELLKNDKFKKYSEKDKIIFFGHYWLRGNPFPFLTSSNAQCMDFSVARDGYLAAYRYNNEKLLSENNLVYV